MMMTKTDLVRPSRDGDQFHYLWAARRCLPLLSFSTSLVAIAIEGASTEEKGVSQPIDDGSDVIDVAEYYGSERIAAATAIKYIQLKHSTQSSDKAWTIGGFSKTLRGFASRYKSLVVEYGADYVQKKFSFQFTTNRPVATDVVEAIADIANLRETKHNAILIKMREYTGLSDHELSSFCQLFFIDDNQDGFWRQRNILSHEFAGYLPDFDIDAPVQLKELVTRKATSEGEKDRSITKIDVLRALKTDPDRLFPATCRIAQIDHTVPRFQEEELLKTILAAEELPVIVHAEVGIGKSIFSTQIIKHLPENSVCIVYDCFGDGQYRNPTSPRHSLKTASTQIANELAEKRLCHPLIPTPHADDADFVRSFLHRCRQAVISIKAKIQMQYSVSY